MLFFKKSQKGSTTVEAALLTPVIILSIVALVYMGLILCERCSMQAAADYASEAGSAAWKHTSAEEGTGKVYAADLGNEALYWRIRDTNHDIKNKKSVAAAYYYKYSQMAVKSGSRETESDVSDCIVYKKLGVELEQQFHIPVPGFMSIFGLDSDLGLKVRSESTINEPAELIRNIDFAADVEKELEKRYPAVKELGDKTRDVLKQINDKIKDFSD